MEAILREIGNQTEEAVEFALLAVVFAAFLSVPMVRQTGFMQEMLDVLMLAFKLSGVVGTLVLGVGIADKSCSLGGRGKPKV